jgi:hypothetical protein
MRLALRLLAIVCTICPVCALSRTKAGRFIARSGFYRAYSRFCPFCRAYRALRAPPAGGTDRPAGENPPP